MYQNEAEARVKENQKNLVEILQAHDFEFLEQNFNKRLIHPAKFYHNYMKTLESLLLYVRASREQSWELRLTSLHYSLSVPLLFCLWHGQLCMHGTGIRLTDVCDATK